MRHVILTPKDLPTCLEALCDVFNVQRSPLVQQSPECSGLKLKLWTQ